MVRIAGGEVMDLNASFWLLLSKSMGGCNAQT